MAAKRPEAIEQRHECRVSQLLYDLRYESQTPLIRQILEAPPYRVAFRSRELRGNLTLSSEDSVEAFKVDG
jgi:hypothetical protein